MASHDFSTASPIRWESIARQVETSLARAIRDGDTRPHLEIAESFLRRSFATSQLPGPAPVYQNAARRALGVSRALDQAQQRPRHRLDEEAIQRAINEDVATAGHTPNTRRHQQILALLRDRLVQLGLEPTYDGLVDCIVEMQGFDVYFEVKSASPETVLHQVRLALGQVLHYMWMDSSTSTRSIRGHLVVEGPWAPGDELLVAFVESLSIPLTWSTDIPSLTTDSLGVP